MVGAAQRKRREGRAGGRREVGSIAEKREGVAALLLHTPADAHTPDPMSPHHRMHVCLCASMVNPWHMGGPWHGMHTVSSACGSVSCTGITRITGWKEKSPKIKVMPMVSKHVQEAHTIWFL